MEINLILTRPLTDEESEFVRNHPEGITQKFFYPIRRLLRNEDYTSGEVVFEEDGMLAYHKLINKHESICGAALMSHVVVERVLRLSITHLPRHDYNLISDLMQEIPDGDEGIFKFAFGDGFIQVASPRQFVDLQQILSNDWSREFAKLMLHVRDVGIHKVQFEDDGPVIERLPTYSTLDQG